MAVAAFVLNRLQLKLKPLTAFSSHAAFRLKSPTQFLLNSSSFIQKQIFYSFFSHIFNTNFQFLNKKPLKLATNASNLTSKSEDSEQEKEKYIRLMKFDEIFWPGIFKHVENALLLNAIMNLRFDPEFQAHKFLFDARKTVVKVSKHLSKGELGKIDDIVAQDAISEIESNLANMSETQKLRLRMKAEDIYLGFIYTFEVKISGPSDAEKRLVEIFCVFHAMKNFEEVKKTHRLSDPHGPPFTFSTVLENAELIQICNYSFIRDFSEGVRGQWIINRLNHFKPADIPDPFDMFRIY